MYFRNIFKDYIQQKLQRIKQKAQSQPIKNEAVVIDFLFIE